MTDSHPIAEALVRTILADPADPLPRLVFADWLDETGTAPNMAWAKYMRLAVDLVHLPLTLPRRAYLEAVQTEAAAEVRAGLTYRAEQFIQHAAAMRQLLPLRCVTLNVETVVVPAAVIEWLPESVARERSALPLLHEDGRMTVAVPDPADTLLIENLAFVLNRRVEALKAPAEPLLAAIDRHYQHLNESQSVVSGLQEFTYPTLFDPLRREAESGPVARVVAILLADAVADQTTEVTVERFGPRVEVRRLIGGERKLCFGLPERLHLPVVARLQLLADLSLGPVEATQLGTLPYVHAGRLYQFGLRVAPARSGPRATLTVPAPTPTRPNPPAA